MDTPEKDQDIVLVEGRKSYVWKYFGFYSSSESKSDALDKSRVICTICRRSFKYSTATSSTSNMVSHLTMAHDIWLHQPNTTGKKKLAIKDATGLEGDVWLHFGFYEAFEGSLDYSHAVCKVCHTKLRYIENSIYNLRRHLQKYHNINLPRVYRVVNTDEELITDCIEDDRPLIEARSIQRPRSITYHAAYRHFGFLEKIDGSGDLDESKVVCKICLHEYSNAGKLHPDYYMDHLKKKHYLDSTTSDDLAGYHNPMVKDLPSTPMFKSKVWQYFGFVSLPNSEEADRSKAICRLCRREIDYITNGVTRLFKHVKQHGIKLQKDIKEGGKFPADVGIFIEARMTKGATARTTYHSPEWEYFGFYAYPGEDGQSTEIDKRKTVCKLCRKKLGFNGRIFSMSMHLHEEHNIVVHSQGKYACCSENNLNSSSTGEQQQGESTETLSTTAPESQLNDVTDHVSDSFTTDMSTLDCILNPAQQILQGQPPLVDMQTLTSRDKVAKAWDYFGFRRTEEGTVDKTRAVCKLCGTSLAYSSSTSNLNKHLAIKHDIHVGGGRHENVQAVFNEDCIDPEFKPTILKKPTKNTTKKQEISTPSVYTSKVWSHFKFREIDSELFDKTHTVCQLCNCELRYCGNTTNMTVHLKLHHGIDLKKERENSLGPTSTVVKSEMYGTHISENEPADVRKTVGDNVENTVSSESDTELVLTDAEQSSEAGGRIRRLKHQKHKISARSKAEFNAKVTNSPYKSKVWKYFTKVIASDSERIRVSCCLCDSQYAYYGNTSNMSFHLKRFHDIDIKLDTSDCDKRDPPIAVDLCPTETNSTDEFPSNDNENSKRNMEDYVKGIINKLSSESDSNTEASPVASTPGKFKSRVWEHFDFGRTKGGAVDRSKVICGKCGHELRYTSSTKCMMNHMESRHGVTVPKLTPLQRSKVWENMEFKTLDNGEVDKSGVKCRLCKWEGVYDGTVGPMSNHLKRKHDINSRGEARGLKPTGSARSKAWNYFQFCTFKDGSEDRANVICAICSLVLKYKSSTSNMLGHLMRTHNVNALRRRYSHEIENSSVAGSSVEQYNDDQMTIAVDSNEKKKAELSEDDGSVYTEDEVAKLWQYFGRFEEAGLIDVTKVICQSCHVKVKYFGTFRHMAKHLYTDHDVDIKDKSAGIKPRKTLKREHVSDDQNNPMEGPLKMKFKVRKDAKRFKRQKSTAQYYEDSISSDENDAWEIGSEDQGFGEIPTLPTRRKIVDAQIVLNRGNLHSNVWRYFGFYQEGEEYSTDYTICKICHTSVHYQSNTRSLHDHLKKHGIHVVLETTTAPRAYTANNSRSGLSKNDDQVSDTGSLEMHNESHQTVGDYSDNFDDIQILSDVFPLHTMGNATEITDHIAKFLCKDLQPFSTIESIPFQNLIQAIVPTYDLPSKTFLVGSIVDGFYEDTRQKIREAFGQADGLTLTGYKWLYRNQRLYMTVNGHLVGSNWQSKTFVLTTAALAPTESGDTMQRLLEDTLQTWKQPRNQKTSFVCETSRPFSSLAPNASGANDESVPLLIGCFGVALNCAVAAGFAIPNVCGVLNKVKTFIRLLRDGQHVEISDHKFQDLEENIPKFWNKTVEGLQLLCEQEKAINTSVCNDSTIAPSAILAKDDYTVLRSIVEIITPIQKITELISKVENPTFSLLAPLLNQATASLKVNLNDSEFVQQFTNAVRERLSTTYTTETVSKAHVAAALDPRFKSLVFLTHENRSFVFDQILKEAVNLQTGHPLPFSDTSLTLDMDVQSVDEESAPTASSPSDIQQKVISSSTSDLSNLFGEIFQSSTSDSTAKIPEQKVQLELVKYQNSEVLAIECNALQWWRLHEFELPLLARLAKCYLSIPLLCMKATYLFSDAKNEMVSKRSVLHETDLDKQLFLENNL